LSCFYEVVLLDLGTGVAGPLARFAIDRADQVVLITTPEWVTATVVFEALSHLRHDRTTLVLNKSLLRSADVPVVEQRFRAQRVHRSVAIPQDQQLATMLDSGTYSLDALTRRTRIAVKQLGLAAAEQLL
jgi:MinD-like ATPase involved in chromosome partitioning or flagellar assembly